MELQKRSLIQQKQNHGKHEDYMINSKESANVQLNLLSK